MLPMDSPRRRGLDGLTVTTDVRWGATLGYCCAIVVLAYAKGLPWGPWVPVFDDAGWLSIMRFWCNGARLYVDVMDYKPPGYFLFLIPFCAVPQQPGLKVMWEFSVFSAPVLFVWGAGVVRLSSHIRHGNGQGLIRAFAFGVLGGAFFWTLRLGQLFSTEYVAAAFALWAIATAMDASKPPAHRSLSCALALVFSALCNAKFVAFWPVYMAFGFLGWRIWLRDLGACVVLTAVVFVSTLGWDVGAYKAMWGGADVRAYHPSSAWARVRELFNSLVRPEHGLMTWAEPLLSALRVSPTQTAIYIPIGVFSTVAFAVAGTRLNPALAPVWALSLFSIWVVGTVWDHTLLQLVPLFIVGILAVFRARGVASGAMVGLLCVVGLFSLAADLSRTQSYFHSTRSAGWAAQAAQLDRELGEALGEGPWVSLLSNGYALWLAQGASRPMNRIFHNYCFHLPAKARVEITSKVSSGQMLVALHTALGNSRCDAHPLVDWIQRHCALKLASHDFMFGPIEVRDCRINAAGGGSAQFKRQLLLAQHERAGLVSKPKRR